jgi:hypothetical protein
VFVPMIQIQRMQWKDGKTSCMRYQPGDAHESPKKCTGLDQSCATYQGLMGYAR